jgi:hypothetical protein
MYAVSSAGSARAIDERMILAVDRWGVSGGAAVASPDVDRSAVSSAGSARAIDERMILAVDRWGVSGGAAVAPPDD